MLSATASTARRLFSSSPSQFTLFSRKSPGFSPANPSMMLTASYFHSAYWVWYVYSFNPALIQAGVTGVDERIGYVGFCLAALMNAGAGVYARHLVSSVELKNNVLKLHTHSLPFGMAEAPTSAGELFRVGEVLIPLTGHDSPNPGPEILTPESRRTYQPMTIQSKDRQPTLPFSYLLDLENGGWPMGTLQAHTVLARGRLHVEEAEKKTKFRGSRSSKSRRRKE